MSAEIGELVNEGMSEVSEKNEGMCDGKMRECVKYLGTECGMRE